MTSVNGATTPNSSSSRRNGTLDSFHQRMVNCTYCDPRRKRPELTTKEYLAKMEEEVAAAPPLTFTERILASAKRKATRTIVWAFDARHNFGGSSGVEAPILPVPGVAPPPRTEQKIFHGTAGAGDGGEDGVVVEHTEEDGELVERPSIDSTSPSSVVKTTAVSEEEIDWEEVERPLPSFDSWAKLREEQ